MKMRLAVALGALVALCAGTAFGQTYGNWGQRNQPTQSATTPTVPAVRVNVSGGVNPTDTTFVPLQFDVNGNLYTVDPSRDRDFSTFVNLFSSASLARGGIYQMNSPKYIGQFSRAALMFNYAGVAAADSDSVAFVVRVYGRTSLNSGNRYLWTPLTSARSSADTCSCNVPASDSLSAIGKCIPSPSFIVLRPPYFTQYGTANGWRAPASIVLTGGTSATAASVRKVQAYAFRQGGANGIMIPLTDDAGAPCPFPYIEVEVGNLCWNRSWTVSCDVWPRVN